jgi:hypothetical protein
MVGLLAVSNGRQIMAAEVTFEVLTISEKEFVTLVETVFTDRTTKVWIWRCFQQPVNKSIADFFPHFIPLDRCLISLGTGFLSP